MNEDRAKLVQVVAEVWSLYPDMRFGQLIANLSQWAVGPTKSAVWDVEDAQLALEATRHLESRKTQT
jgi:hypothetical protein